MSVLRVVIATNFPEGNWQHDSDELKLAQSMGNSLQSEGVFQAASNPSVGLHQHFRGLLANLVDGNDDQYFLFLTALHWVVPGDIIKAARHTLATGDRVVQFPSRLIRAHKDAEAVSDLLYAGAPPLVAAKLPNTTPVRLSGLMMRRDALAEFSTYLRSQQLGKLIDVFPGSDGMGIALRLFLAERGVDVAVADGPLFQMRNRYVDPIAMPTIHRRLILAAVYRRVGGLILQRKRTLKAPRLRLRKRLERQSLKDALAKCLGISARVPFAEFENLSLSKRESLKLLRKAQKRISTRLGVLSWQISF
jgi:hypothetical protein